MKAKYQISSWIVFLVFFASHLGFAQHVAVIVSRDSEYDYIKKHLTHRIVEAEHPRNILSGSFGKLNVVMSKAGIGLVNAALTCQMLLERFDPKLIVSAGLSAGINDDLNIAEIVIPYSFIRYDIGTYTDAGFLHGTAPHRATTFEYHFPNRHAAFWKQFSASSSVSNAQVNACLASGDAFLKSRKKRKWIRKKFNADIVDTSGAAIASVCLQNNTPFLIIRQISDRGNQHAGKDFMNFADDPVDKLGAVVVHVLSSWQKQKPPEES